MEIIQRIQIQQVDITKLAVDAIVNAANKSLLGGGGVDGAIHSAAGPELLKACHCLNGCETGEAKITPGFNLSAKYVIHTVGPVWRGGDHDEALLLANAYENSLRLAAAHELDSIAFPAISCGVYGFPGELASKIAVSTILDFCRQYQKPTIIVLVAYSKTMFDLYQQQIQEVMSQ
ncbi:MAG: O-acetyl-ADP-ribose deacetylase [Gammaproteobacteria bacterium]|nr:O-acetyl-ADP-ribose deacetylase [Gammaproteobacteria bacterium]